MHVVVLVNGREAIPVRAIPLVAPVPYGVRYLVEGLMCCDRSNAMHGLTAYQWSPGAKHPLAVPPTQWMQVDSRLRALKASLERQESTELLSCEEGEDRYNRESISILPAGVFVWKDDFVDARTRRLRRVPEHEIVAFEDSWRDHLKFLQQQLELPANDPAVDQWECSLGANWREQLAAYIAEERAIDPFPSESIVLYERNHCGQAPLTDVSFSPLLEVDLCKRVMEGFEDFVPVEKHDRTSEMNGSDILGSVPSTPAADLHQSMSHAALGYNQLLKICSVQDEDDFGGYVVKKTGIYVKNHKKHHKQAWSLLTPGEKAALAWHPTGEYDKPALPLPCTLGQLRSFVVEAGLAGCLDEAAIGQLLTSVMKDGEAVLLPSKKEDATPVRFAQRTIQDGFERATRETAGERNFEAKVAAVTLTDETCIELAHSHELRIADWTALTGIGIGVHWSHVVTVEEVAFRKWTEWEITEASVDQQIDMHHDNEVVPLQFPCTPARLIQFIDAAPPGSHSFSVPDAFRKVVTERAQTPENTQPESTNAPPSVGVANHSGTKNDRAVRKEERDAKRREKVVALAQAEGERMWRRGERQISHRSVSEAVRKRLEPDPTTHGTRGPAGNSTIRTDLSRAKWTFEPPQSGQSGQS